MSENENVRSIGGGKNIIVKLDGRQEKVIFQPVKLGQLLKIFKIESISGSLKDGIKKNDKESFTDYLIRTNDVLKASCGLGFDDFQDLDGDQIQGIYEVFQEVNSVFFAQARRMMPGLTMKTVKNLVGKLMEDKQMILVKNLIITKFVESFVSFSNQDTLNAKTTNTNMPSTVTKLPVSKK